MFALSGAVAFGASDDSISSLGQAGSGIGVFSKPAGVSLEAKCGGVQSEPSGSVQLCGWVNPRGTTVTRCEFEYGGTSSYEKDVPCSPEPPYTGEEPVQVTAIVKGLQPGVTYHYRLAITNESGTTYGPDEELSTPAIAPAVISESVAGVTSNDATLEAEINPGGAETTYQFQIAKSPACLPPPGPGFMPCFEVEIGDLPSRTIAAGAGSQIVSLNLASAGMTLDSGATYAIRVVASNSAAPGGVHGEAKDFTTPESLVEIEQEEAAAKAQEQTEAAAAKKHQEEAEAAAAKTHQVEEAATKKTLEETKTKQEEEAFASKPVSVMIVNVAVNPSSATVTLYASRAGAVTISGRGLKTTSKGITPGSNRIKVALTKVGKSSRKHHQKVRITVQVRTVGRAMTTAKTVKL